MEPNLIFIDQTLSYALRSKAMDAGAFILIKQKIAGMAKVIFDIPLDSLTRMQGYPKIDFQDIRAGIPADVNLVKRVADLGCNYLKLSFEPVALRNSLPQLMATLAEAGQRGIKIAISGINIAQDPLDTIVILRKLIKEDPSIVMILDDPDGRLDPLATYGVLLDLKRAIPCSWLCSGHSPWEYHGRNTLGLATGNVLGAIKTGTRNIAVSIGGVGGYPAFEEVIMSIGHLLRMPVSVPPKIATSCQEILNCMGQSIPVTKPIIGSRIFAHELGIHVDGVVKKSELYEPFAPETVGLARLIVIGKHSGKAALEQKLKELNLNVDPSQISQVLEKVRELSIRRKGPVSDVQLRQLVGEAEL